MTAPERPAIVILGVTSAIARATANAFAAAGQDLVIAARDEGELNRIAADIEVRYTVRAHAVALDAEDPASVDLLFDRCHQAAPHIAGVVLGFGYMESQSAAQEDAAIIRRTFSINLTEAAVILEQFAAHFERQGTGFIAGISSVAGDRGRQSNYIYGTSKAGFSAYLQGLRNRLHHSGVRVITIKPGFVDTKMTFGLPGLFLVATPEAAGRAIHRAIVKGKDVAYVPWFWRYIMLIIRAIPERVFKRLKL